MEMERYSIRFHGLGGQGLKSMIQEILAPLLSRAGFFVQAFPFFSGDRRGAPVAGYFRFGTKPITTRSFIEEPDMVVVFGTKESAPLRDIMGGLKPNGVLLVNTANVPDCGTNVWRLFSVDANTISFRNGIGRLEDPYAVVNSAMAGAVTQVLHDEYGIVIDGQYVREIITHATPRHAEKNIKAFEGGATEVKRLWSARISAANAESAHKRITQPNDRCTFCRLCYTFCPKRAIAIANDNKTHVIDESACNYCGVCIAVCPRDAISFIHSAKEDTL